MDHIDLVPVVLARLFLEQDLEVDYDFDLLSTSALTLFEISNHGLSPSSASERVG